MGHIIFCHECYDPMEVGDDSKYEIGTWICEDCTNASRENQRSSSEGNGGLCRQDIEKAAAAIANQRGMRRGVPKISNILEMLPAHLKKEVMEDAEAALKAVAE